MLLECRPIIRSHAPAGMHCKPYRPIHHGAADGPTGLREYTWQHFCGHMQCSYIVCESCQGANDVMYAV
eukprot:scaffold259875_cov33-Prasinocladus_malaysianus.AAC.2